MSPAPSVPVEDEIDLRDLLGMILDGRWIIAGVAAFAILMGVFYAWTTERVYEADALVQVELDEKSLNSALGELGDILGSQTPVTAEIEILKSRLVIGSVVDDLNLTVTSEPRYFPLVGRAIARSRSGDQLEPPALGLRGFAWDGESIRVGALEVPDALLDQRLSLRATDDGYELIGPGDQLLLQGRVGERAAADTVNGHVEIFVTEMRAYPGVRFTIERAPRLEVIQNLIDRLRVTEKGKDSGILAVSLEDNNPKRAEAVVNHLVTAYQRQNVERKSAEAEQTLSFLDKQLPKLKQELEASESALNDYRLRQGSADLTKETELVLTQSVELEKRRVELEQQREQALQSYTVNHPVVLAIDGQLQQIQQEQDKVQLRVKNLPETQQELLRLSRDVQVNTELYTSLLNSAQELQVVKAGTVGNVRIIDYAAAASRPTSPRVGLTLALSLMLGIFLGLAAVFVRRALRGGVEDPSEVEQALGIPTYAAIPYSPAQRTIARAMAREPGHGAILAVSHPSNVAVESLRSLRTALHFAMLETGNNIVMLTGPSPSLGKSFVSINFGAVLAAAGRRVLVVDGDMRRGHLHEYLNRDRAPGLSDLIAGTATEADVVLKTNVPNLSFVATGTIPPNPAELLLSEQLTAFLNKCSADFDHVIIDTPPVLAVTDAAVVGRLAGTTLLLLKAGEHPLRAIEDTLRRLQNAGINVKGVIFNQVGRRGTSRYGYGYGYSYGYYEYQSVKQ